MSVTIAKWLGGILRKYDVLLLTVVMGTLYSFAARVLQEITATCPALFTVVNKRPISATLSITNY